MYGIQQWVVKMFKNIYLNSSCCVKIHTGTTDYFTIVTGFCQSCILSLFLFLHLIDFIMCNAERGPNFGIRWKEQTWLTDLDFAFDKSLQAETKSRLQKITINLEDTARKVGLRVYTAKAKMMQIGTDSHMATPITIGQHHIDNVDHFTYI